MKRSLISFLVLSVLLIFITSSAHSQFNRHVPYIEKANGLIGLQVGIPSKAMQEAIKNKMGNLGFGLGFTALTNPFAWGRNKRNSPLRIGGELGYTYYGRFLSEVNINGNKGDYKTSYGIVQANGIIQIRPTLPEKVSPFFEVFAGGVFYLSTTKENLSAIESSLGIPSFDFGGYSSASFNKGLAIGCSFGRPSADEPRFTMRLSYNWGNKIKYVIRNSLEYDPGSGGLVYYVGEAPVRYLMVQIGIGI